MTTLDHGVRCVDLDLDDPAWARALPVLRQLRPHLTEQLLGQVLGDDAAPTFTALFGPDGDCVTVAGWRIMPTTANPSGRRLHVDDLVTAEAHRGAGYGARLLRVLENRAVATGCEWIELDSGVQRTAAHDFYRARGMTHTCHHFGKQLDGK